MTQTADPRLSVEGDIWILNTGDRTISVIDPHTDTAAAAFGGPIVGPGMAFGFGDAWIGSGVSLTRLQPSTHEATATIQLYPQAPPGESFPILVATGGGMSWAGHPVAGSPRRHPGHAGGCVGDRDERRLRGER